MGEDRRVWLIEGATGPHRPYFGAYTRYITAPYAQGRSNDNCRYRSERYAKQSDGPHPAAPRVARPHRYRGSLG